MTNTIKPYNLRMSISTNDTLVCMKLIVFVHLSQDHFHLIMSQDFFVFKWCYDYLHTGIFPHIQSEVLTIGVNLEHIITLSTST